MVKIKNVSGVPDEGFAPFIYDWSTGDTGTSITVTSGGPELISLEVVDYCENTVADSFLVRVPEPFVIEPDLELCLGATSGAIVLGGSTPYTFVYNTDSLTLDGTTFTPGFEGIYEVTVIDACGETGTLFIESFVCNTIIPNVFSPNADGKNDLFIISGLEGFSQTVNSKYSTAGAVLFMKDLITRIHGEQKRFLMEHTTSYSIDQMAKPFKWRHHHPKKINTNPF